MHACIGVGSLNPLKDIRSSDGISNCAKDSTGTVAEIVSGVCIVTECFSRNALASAGEATKAMGVGEVSFEDDRDASDIDKSVVVSWVPAASFLRFFFSFFDSDAVVDGLAAFSSSASLFRFFFFSFDSIHTRNKPRMPSRIPSYSRGGLTTIASSSTTVGTASLFFFFLLFFSGCS